jgi:hypothetical protein
MAGLHTNERRRRHERRAVSQVEARLFCLLENADTTELYSRGLKGPSIVVINGMRKPDRTTFTDRDYHKQVRTLGEQYRANTPRRLAR